MSQNMWCISKDFKAATMNLFLKGQKDNHV